MRWLSGSSNAKQKAACSPPYCGEGWGVGGKAGCRGCNTAVGRRTGAASLDCWTAVLCAPPAAQAHQTRPAPGGRGLHAGRGPEFAADRICLARLQLPPLQPRPPPTHPPTHTHTHTHTRTPHTHTPLPTASQQHELATAVQRAPDRVGNEVGACTEGRSVLSCSIDVHCQTAVPCSCNAAVRHTKLLQIAVLDCTAQLW